jgi:Mg-chelatase subunit ChlD
MVIGGGLFDLDETVLDRIAYVAIFGDPTYTTLTDQAGPLSDRCEDDWLPSWVQGTGQCWQQGALGERIPYIPFSLDGRVGSWCSLGDYACSSIPTDLANFLGDGGPHGKYFTDGHVAKATQKAAESLEAFLPDQADDIDASFLRFATGGAGADLAFIFDTTGSMGGSIANAKAEATDLANLWLSNSTNGRIALVEFRDQGDAFVSRIVLPLTADAEDFQTAVNGLVAAGGGDVPEAQLSGVMTALDGLDWQAGATKIGIVITDAVGRDPEPVTGYTRAQAAQRALEIDPVAVYGVNVSTLQSVTDWMRPIADATAGEVAVLGQGQTLSDLLADVMNEIALNPVAVLGGPYFAASGNPVFFDADRSFDPDADLISYKWDFDSDGTTDQTTTEPKVAHTYSGTYSGIAAVRVVSADGGEALGSAVVTVDAAGLADEAAVAPTAASASVTGPSEVTVTWTPAPNDRADDYVVRLSDSALLRSTPVGAGNSVTIAGLDLSLPMTFSAQAANEFGLSAGVSTAPVGGGPGPVTTQLVSISTSRAKGNGASLDAYVDADARRVVYHSDATNLAPGDTNNLRDVFVRDRLNGTTTLVSASAAGTIGNGHSQDPAISKDGRYVTFRSQANNLVSGDTNGTAWDIFVKDLQTGAVERVSVSSAGAQANGASQNPLISADGRFVAFRSSATNLVSGDTNGQPDVFVRDRQTTTTTRVSVATGGGQATGGVSDDPAISDDGRYVAFQSDATNVVAGDTNAKTDIFRHDRQTNTTIRVSVGTAGAQSNGVSTDPALSGDGSRVVWESIATNLVIGDTNGKEDVFVRLIGTGETIRVSVSSAGAQATSGSNDASLSTGGTKVAFYSTSTNLVSGDTNSRGDVFTRDLTASITERASLTAAGGQVNEASSAPWLSGDGSAVAFSSVGTNVVPEDTDSTSDVYVRGPAMPN